MMHEIYQRSFLRKVLLAGITLCGASVGLCAEVQKKVEDAGIRFFTQHRLDSKEDIVKDGATIGMIHLNHAPIMCDFSAP